MPVGGMRTAKASRQPLHTYGCVLVACPAKMVGFLLENVYMIYQGSLLFGSFPSSTGMESIQLLETSFEGTLFTNKTTHFRGGGDFDTYPFSSTHRLCGDAELTHRLAQLLPQLGFAARDGMLQLPEAVLDSPSLLNQFRGNLKIEEPPSSRVVSCWFPFGTIQKELALVLARYLPQYF